MASTVFGSVSGKKKEIMKATLIRLDDNTEKQSLGRLYLHNGLVKIFDCCTLELPDKSNQNNISRIPPGHYVVTPRWSKKFKNHFHVLDVKGRSHILIHAGNFYTQIEGCILVGTSFTDINNDGEKDVIWSGHTLKKLLQIAPNGFTLDIINES